MKGLKCETLYSAIDIDAPAERIWDILTDFDAYSEWNPFITRIAGTPRVNERLDVHLQPPGGMAITLHPILLEVAPGDTLRWLGRLLLPGVFDGEHHFVLESLGPDRTRLVQQERFNGLLVGVFASSLDQHTLAGFHAMNAALKLRAEAPADGQPMLFAGSNVRSIHSCQAGSSCRMASSAPAPKRYR